ncbi:hypothetical protein [Comamonas serinivorans]|nr:hypothetical protein [Comamonas serinivorans]
MTRLTGHGPQPFSRQIAPTPCSVAPRGPQGQQALRTALSNVGAWS